MAGKFLDLKEAAPIASPSSIETKYPYCSLLGLPQMPFKGDYLAVTERALRSKNRWRCLRVHALVPR